MITQSRAPRLPSVWTLGRMPRASRWPLGLITPQHKLASSAYLPTPRLRISLEGDKFPYWYVINQVLTARQSLDGQIVPETNFILLAIMASSTPGPPGFRSHFWQIVNETTTLRMNRQGVNWLNMFGSGDMPFYLRRPYPMPNGFALVNRSGDLSGLADTIQIVLYGVKEVES